MNTGNFSEFTTALAAFESGIDLTVAQTQASLQYLRVFDTQYGNVDPTTVDFNNIDDLANLQYHVHNTIGFLGKYQFGEPLLIDLGYYVPAETGFYGSTATNEWKGEWTGKNGVNSKEDFMSEVQELAIREAFDMNMGVIDQYLSQGGKTIDDFLGQEFTYTRLGEVHTAEVTMSGILSSAHLQGPGGVAQLLLHNVASNDEYGTNILFYMDKFSGYSTPYGTDADDVLSGSDYSETFAGEGGDNTITTGDGDDKIVIANNADGSDTILDFTIGNDVISLSNFPGVTFEDLNISSVNQGSEITFPNGQTLTLANVDSGDLSAEQFVYGPYNISWNANSGDTVIDNFNLNHDLIDLNYAFASNNLDIYEENGSAVIEVVDNNQRIILEGIAVDDLSSAQFVKAPHDFATAHFGINSDYTPPENNDSSDDGVVVVDNNTGEQQGTNTGDSFSYNWNWGARDIVNDFNPNDDFIDLTNFWSSFDQIDAYDNVDGNAVIDLTDLNNQTITLNGVSVAELSASNFNGVSGDWQYSDDAPQVDDSDDSEQPPVDASDNSSDPVVDNTPDDTSQTPNDDVSSDGGEYAYTWNWGANEVINNFDLSQDVLNLEAFWTDFDEIDIRDSAEGDAVIDLSALNNQTITLLGVSSSSLSDSNFVGVSGEFNNNYSNDGNSDSDSGVVVDTPDNSSDNPAVNDDLGLINHGVNDTNLVATDNANDVFNFTWNWGSQKTITGFNAEQDVVDLTKFWTSEDQVDIYDDGGGNAVIDLTDINNQTITLLGVSAGDLDDSNVII
ncbi:MAG: hypothetical protein P1U74_01490 [Legionellaceae bacterium]|nr:hypothetical protein [Legionellaceae bacterium]